MTSFQKVFLQDNDWLIFVNQRPITDHAKLRQFNKWLFFFQCYRRGSPSRDLLEVGLALYDEFGSIEKLPFVSSCKPIIQWRQRVISVVLAWNSKTLFNFSGGVVRSDSLPGIIANMKIDWVKKLVTAVVPWHGLHNQEVHRNCSLLNNFI